MKLTNVRNYSLESNIRIEPFRSAQAEAVSHLIRRNLREVNSLNYSDTFIVEQVGHYSSERLLVNSRKQYIIVAVDDDDNVIGTAALVNGGSVEEPNYYCVAVFVLPEWHRNGVGTRLMQTVEAKARALQAPRITVPAAMSAKGFYLKLGYTFEDGIEALDEHDEYRMVKNLTSPSP